uniref:Uncharacterized protein n=1 Tax=Neogobius melanostomus TaxID=47308 RepID=A0A8C6S2K9_9GOBI
LQEVPLSTLWPRNQTLRSLAALLTAADPEMNKAAADYLSSAQPSSFFRTRVIETMLQHNVHLIKAVVALCDSADEELRHVAIETLLTFGDEGRLAYEQLDALPGEIFRLGIRRSNAVTTAF